MRRCTDCDGLIEDGAPDYYRQCRACYRSGKQRETDTLNAEVGELRARVTRRRRLARRQQPDTSVTPE